MMQHMRGFLLFLLLFSFGWAEELSISSQDLQKNLSKHIKYSSEGPNWVGYIYIGDHEKQITQATYIYVKNAMDFFKDRKPIFILLELNTPGGQLFAAQKISDLLKEMDIQYGIPIVAVINNWAISAGAMLAYSCRYIATVKDGVMGAAEPVLQSGQKTSEKVNSAIRADFGSRASFFDRNPLIAEAMVDADTILVLREGKIVKLASSEEIRKEDFLITSKGKLLTLTAQEMTDLGVADFYLPPQKLVPITEEEKKLEEWPASKELLFTAPFFKEIPMTKVVAFNVDWKTHFFAFLSSSVVTSLLLLGVMIFFYIELNSPGFGVPGILGLFCLFLLLLSSFSIQAANWFEVIVLLAGIVLILLEIFVIPGFGLTGILGIILTLAGLFGLLLPGIQDVHFDFDTKTLNAAGQFFVNRLAWLSGTILVGIILILLLTRFVVPRLTFLSPLILRGEQEAKEGYVSGLSEKDLPKVGEIGEVISPLRTAGKIKIGENYFDAVSSGKFLEKGQKIHVVAIEGSRIVVEELE